MRASAAHERKGAKELQAEFIRVPALCGAILVAIHVVPKDPGRAPLRLLLTVVYFAALLTGLWYLSQPRRRFMKDLYAWRYQDCGPVIEKSWQMYLHSVNEVIDPLCYVLMAFIGSSGLATLGHWPAFGPLAAFRSLYDVLWWFSGAALVGYPMLRGSQISEMQQRRRMLHEQLEISEVRPRTDADARSEQDAKPRAPVEVTGDHEFAAGGFAWSWEDFYKNCIVFGQSGTGKTVCVLNALLDGLLASTSRSPQRPSGLILDPKGDFYSKIRKVCAKHGRNHDLLVIDPADLQRSIRYNPLDSDDDELELAARFAAVLEALGMKSEQDTFWIDSAKKFLRHSIALIRITNPPGRPPSFEEIGELAVSMLAISERADKIADDDPRGDQCLSYFCNEWMELANETRSSIQAYITNMLDPFLMEPYRTLVSGRSTLRISEMVTQGKILYVYMPIADKEAMSRVICTAVKLEYFREVLKRPNKPRSSFFLCDEFQSYFTVAKGKGDADFFERSRQSNHANIIATQNLPALNKQTREKDPVQNLLGNCAVKVFLRNSDGETNKYASELFGETLVQFWGGGASGGSGKGLRGMMGSSSQSASLQYDAKVRKEVFASLAVPSRPDAIDYCETIVHLGSRGHVGRERLRWKVYPLTQ